jgi:hypothetical protein
VEALERLVDLILMVISEAREVLGHLAEPVLEPIQEQTTQLAVMLKQLLELVVVELLAIRHTTAQVAELLVP